jgi:hypothetical protein
LLKLLEYLLIMSIWQWPFDDKMVLWLWSKWSFWPFGKFEVSMVMVMVGHPPPPQLN